MKMTKILALIMIVAGISSCSEKPEIQVTVAPPGLDPKVFTIVRIDANLLIEKPASDENLPKPILTLNQGDQIMVLETKGAWSKVQHIISGRIGWLNNVFIQIETRSRWWSGDTDKARMTAERLYKDKIFMMREWPIQHINIEERWNKLAYTIAEDATFPKNQATECVLFALENLQKEFPHWRDHLVVLESGENGQKYTLVMGDDKKAVFL